MDKKIAIHNSYIGFHARWIAYCEANNIPYKLVDCYSSNIIKELEDCSALMWHHWQTSTKDWTKAKRLLFSLEHAGLKVFPNFRTNWHFDDKYGQKYLLEALKLPLVPSYHFIQKDDALKWVEKQSFPIIHKLSKGAGSSNVTMVRSKLEAIKLIHKAFGRGFPVYNGWEHLRERYRKVISGSEPILGLARSLYRWISPPIYSKYLGRQSQEIYFQEYIENEGYDIRIIVVNDRAFAIKRLARKDDFRASGSGTIEYERSLFREEWIQNAFSWSKKLNMQVVAFDIVIEKETQAPFIIEVSYGYTIDAYDHCVGYWTSNMQFVSGKFDSCKWMIEDLIDELKHSLTK